MRHRLTMLVVLAATASTAAAAEKFADARNWPADATQAAFRVPPGGGRRIGFTLPAEARGRRVVIAYSAVLESPTASGYSESLAIEVNGELMGLRLAGRPRLLNRPMEWRFGKPSPRTATAGRDDVGSFIDHRGSALWTMPAAPSVAALRASADYAPIDVRNVVYTVLEITDMVYADSFNYLTLTNHSDGAAILFTELRIRHEPTASDRPDDDEEKIRVIQRGLLEEHLDRPALHPEPVLGREWVYNMDLVDSNHGGSETLGEIQDLDDARRIVKQHTDNGFNALIVSGLHFRYSYLPLWETRILPYMRLITQAAHEAGVKVIDHYDVPIFFSGGYPFLLEDGHLEWTQRDLRYGTPTRMYCINNPGFRDHFFDWTRRVQRECGIDAYQIDEVTYFSKNYCGCEHCRRLFTEDTGLELPREPDSPVLFNEASALWRVFRLWREISMQKFRTDFLAAVRRENPAVFLSDYTSTHYLPSGEGGFWPNVFVSYANGTEAMSRVPFDTYHQGLVDMRLRSGLADAFGHASWVLWYPLTGSTARFCWALSQATGQAQWHTSAMAGSVRDLVKWPHKMDKLEFTTCADVAMIFSEKSKNASMRSGGYHGMETFGWGAALVDANVQYHNIQEIAVTPELLSRYKLVILPQMTIIDGPNRAALEAYVRGGGKLVVTGETGMLDELGRPRADFLLGEMMGVGFVDFLEAPFEVVEPDGKSFPFDNERMLYGYGKRMLLVAPRDRSDCRTIVTFRKDGRDHPGVVEAACGEGKVYTVAGFLGISNFVSTLDEGQKQIFRFNPDAAAFMGRWLRGVLGEDETLVPLDLPAKTVVTSWVRKHPRREIDVHFLNVQDHTRVVDVEIGRREIRFPPVERPLTVLLRRVPVQDAAFHAPDLPDPVPCAVEPTAEGTTITVPAGKMSMYGLLKIHTAGDVP